MSRHTLTHYPPGNFSLNRNATPWATHVATAWIGLILAGAAMPYQAKAFDDVSQVVARVKPSVVGVGTFQRLRSPAIAFTGTGFVIGDGLTVITAAHVLTRAGEPGVVGQPEELGIVINQGETPQFRPATVAAIDSEHDLAQLRLSGVPLPALQLGDSAAVREGQSLVFTGFPLGMALGLHHATHRAMVAAIAPIALAALNARRLDVRSLSQLQKRPYMVFQLDGTAYPGNSGSPLYDPSTGNVVGVVNMVFVKNIKEGPSASPSGISYAIPANFIRDMSLGPPPGGASDPGAIPSAIPSAVPGMPGEMPRPAAR